MSTNQGTLFGSSTNFSRQPAAFPPVSATFPPLPAGFPRQATWFSRPRAAFPPRPPTPGPPFQQYAFATPPPTIRPRIQQSPFATPPPASLFQTPPESGRPLQSPAYHGFEPQTNRAPKIPPFKIPGWRPPIQVRLPDNAAIMVRYNEFRSSMLEEKAIGRAMLELAAENARVRNYAAIDEAWRVLVKALEVNGSD